MKPFLLSIAFVIISSLLCSSSPAQTSSDPLPRETGRVRELPIQLGLGYLVVVEGSIGKLQQLTFLIDTGAFPSVVDQRIASALDLTEKEGRVALVNATVATKLATLPFVQLGPVRVEDVPVLVQDLSSIEKTLARRVDAVIGLDVLGKNSFSINYRSKRMHFGPVERSRSAMPFQSDGSFVVVEARLHDQSVRLMVDTGASALMLFRSRLKGSISGYEGRIATATNLGGRFQRQSVWIPEACLGKENLGPVRAFVVADQKDDGRDFDGVLSVRGLGLEEITFDFENREMSWRK